MNKKLFICAAFFCVPFLSHASDDISLQEQIDALQHFVDHNFVTLETPALTTDELRTIVSDATTWIQNSQEENGHFKYEYKPFTDEYPEGDNIVRQAGTFYELGEVARHNPNFTPGLQETMASSIAYFESLSREDTFLGIDFRCIVEDKESNRCKLGATSLALIGILSYVEAYPEEKDAYEELIDDYLQYIISAKEADAGFRNIHFVGRSGQPRKESSFSNGEAMLALVRYYQYEENDAVWNLANEIFAYLGSQEFDSALYLWIMAALKDMQAITLNPAYVLYADAFTDARLGRSKLFMQTNNNYCAPTEGYASAYSILDGNIPEEKVSELRGALDYWNTKNYRLQITNEIPVRAFFNDGALSFERVLNMQLADGGFLTADDEHKQRIDFTQHCISAYLQTLVDIEGGSL